MYLLCSCPSPLSMLLVRVPCCQSVCCWRRLLASGLPAGAWLLASGLPAGAWLLASGQKKSWPMPASFRNVLEGGC